ncbi:hypothetical protein [Lysinibacillus sp. Bpr_S20]|uniref:hypothetical protein n=1 Tax=Lysinibacillus sp. Bpr_S20 TaxID=2933964 RepID=UPI00201314AB|nr:hypothetical protein [Lysinibacillus sp. Bpr_S20]MCL1702982.1 hypothetical protein [Lysinibacillus sp. Bpr_S20]
MNNSVYISDCTLVTLSGFDPDTFLESHHIVNNIITKPSALKGLTPKIDNSTALAVSAVVKLNEKLKKPINKEKTGILIGSKTGNHQIAYNYANRVRKGSSSPAMYSVSGYNMSAGLSALATKLNGPTMVLSGEKMNIADCILISSNYIYRNDADNMMVGQVDINNKGDWGSAIFFRISNKREAQSIKIDINVKADPSSKKSISSSVDSIPIQISSYLNEAYDLYNYFYSAEKKDKFIKSLNKVIIKLSK